MYGRQANPVFSDDYKVIRQALVDARRTAGLSQASLAARIGKAKSHVAMIERGQRRIDALELYVVAEALGIDPETFFATIAQQLNAFRSAASAVPRSIVQS